MLNLRGHASPPDTSDERSPSTLGAVPWGCTAISPTGETSRITPMLFGTADFGEPISPEEMAMTTIQPRDARRHGYAAVHACAVAVAFVSGTLALVAMLVGTPLQFGGALALCGVGWIVTHFVERLAEQDLAQRRRLAPAADLVHGYVRFSALVQSHRRMAHSRHTVSVA